MAGEPAINHVELCRLIPYKRDNRAIKEYPGGVFEYPGGVFEYPGGVFEYPGAIQEYHGIAGTFGKIDGKIREKLDECSGNIAHHPGEGGKV